MSFHPRIYFPGSLHCSYYYGIWLQFISKCVMANRSSNYTRVSVRNSIWLDAGIKYKEWNFIRPFKFTFHINSPKIYR